MVALACLLKIAGAEMPALSVFLDVACAFLCLVNRTAVRSFAGFLIASQLRTTVS